MGFIKVPHGNVTVYQKKNMTVVPKLSETTITSRTMADKSRVCNIKIMEHTVLGADQTPPGKLWASSEWTRNTCFKQGECALWTLKAKAKKI